MNNKHDITITAPAFLVEADSYTHGCEKVWHFLENTILIRYDNIDFAFDRSRSASDQEFWTMVDNVIEKNRQSVIGLIDELRKSGYHQLRELAEMKQGYESKILHILVHLLDGFIGIDSKFYNLIEDSHQISDSLRRKIKQTPGHYWLLQVEAENPRSLV